MCFQIAETETSFAKLLLTLLVALLMQVAVSTAAAQAVENATPPATESVPAADDDLNARHAAFEKRMSGSSLVGSFTTLKGDDEVADRDKPLTEERYDIVSVKKAKVDDYWIITARIRYGKHDLTVPVPVEVKWAGATPMIILNKVAVPGLGTFDARVLINGCLLYTSPSPRDRG